MFQPKRCSSLAKRAKRAKAGQDLPGPWHENRASPGKNLFRVREGKNQFLPLCALGDLGVKNSD